MCMVCGNFLDSLFTKGLLIDMGVEGLYGRSGIFEDVVERLTALITRIGKDGDAEVIRFPPGMNRKDFERSGYLKGFPQLAGTIHSFEGGDKEHATLLEKLHANVDWTDSQEITDVALMPAACYPLYPVVARRGALPKTGGLYDIYSYCFRHEPSRDPGRMQMFRQREYVRIGTPEQVVAFRELWLQRAQEMIALLEMPFALEVANDPFFGRAGRMMAASQRDQELKFELLIRIDSPENKPTACISFNYHQDHFGANWGIKNEEGATAHTACVGFGMERCTLALFKTHGLDVDLWPHGVRDALWG
ncbi:amino acid--[acyl-carrier-protein] ligase [Beijerinckia sp. L45]|uniref:amino acid--[acyl-carrier-protein] ligase n=1 Tax=Beijerinckia sp. L45 TaxID=1641855 RepID=UPI00131AD8A4|nr:amino acid--[acyl-carrier-protein] ligase [Beijerinckia sp. L45]